MSRFNQQNELSQKALIYRVVIAIASVLLIVAFMPRDTSSKFQFDLGKPWRYSQLIATYDFPIYKSDITIKHEQDSILKEFTPYFARNESIVGEQLAKLEKTFETQLKDKVPEYYLPYLKRKLEHLYKQGVMSIEDFDKVENDSISQIRIFSANEANVNDLHQIYSYKTAYEYLASNNDDSTRYERRLLRKCNLSDLITANLTYDQQKSDEYRKDLLSSLSYAKGMVMSGQKIIDRGEIVDEDRYNILMSMEKELAKRSNSVIETNTMFFGQLLFSIIIIVCLTLYFSLFRRDYLVDKRSLILIGALVVIYPLATSLLATHGIFSVYIIPFAMAPIFIRVFMDSRTAFVVHVAIVMLCAICLEYPFEFICTQLVAGMVGIYSLRELSQRSQLMRTALLVTITSLAFYFSLEMIQEKNLSRLDYSMYMYIIINGIFLLFAYPLLFLIEKGSGFTSNVTLVELSNINNELLRKVSENAPGTFQHSMQVANLAAAVANKIGAKSQLVRTGALYHDIGKMYNPTYFTENQNAINPHDSLPYETSSQYVIAHVYEGIKLAEKYNLPQVIKDFITTHHGKGKTKYFLISFKNLYPDVPVDESKFSYPGPNPFTLEQAILMMADSVEAASRSLQEYTADNISNLVDKIIDAQISEGFFTDCPITFKDITEAKAVFKEKLKTMYHTRISYPELKKEQDGKEDTNE